MPLMHVEKIGDTDRCRSSQRHLPLAGIRALGMASHRGRRDGPTMAPVRRRRFERLAAARLGGGGFPWDVQVGDALDILVTPRRIARSSSRPLQASDVFFANKRPGFLDAHGWTQRKIVRAEARLIHATVVLHGEKGPWSNRPRVHEIGAAVSGVFTIEGTPTAPRRARPSCPSPTTSSAGWAPPGILAGAAPDVRSRAGSYRVVVSLTRPCLRLLSLGSSTGLRQIPPARLMSTSTPSRDLFTAETPCVSIRDDRPGRALADTGARSRIVLVPRGSRQTPMASRGMTWLRSHRTTFGRRERPQDQDRHSSAGGFWRLFDRRSLERLCRRRPDVEIVSVSRDNFIVLTPCVEVCSGRSTPPLAPADPARTCALRGSVEPR